MTVSSRLLLRTVVIALAIALCLVTTLYAQTTADQRSTTKPHLLAAATPSDVWVVQRTREPLDSRDLTIIRRMSTGPQSDARYREVDTTRGDVVDLATSGDRLVILFADGSWGWIAPGGTFVAGQAIDRELTPVSIAGGPDAVWFLCNRTAPSSTTTASTAPATTRSTATLWLVRRSWNGAIVSREAVGSNEAIRSASIGIAQSGDSVLELNGVARRGSESSAPRRHLLTTDGSESRVIPLDGWHVPAALVAEGKRVELFEWTSDGIAAPVALQVDEAITKDRAWTVAVSNGELRFVARSGFSLIDQIIKRDGTPVRAPQSLQIVASDRVPPGAQAVQLALMLALGAVVLIVWQRASRPGAAGVLSEPGSRAVDASGKPITVATPAPLTARCLAASIDYMPVWLVIGLGVARQSDAAMLIALQFAAVVGYVVYCTVSEAAFGRTVGKRMLRLRVVTLTGEKPGLASIVLRNVLRAVEAHPLFLAFALFSMMVTPMRQRLGDFVAGTTVVSDEAGSKDDSVQNRSGRADDRDAE